jgi:hypothetical protein
MTDLEEDVRRIAQMVRPTVAPAPMPRVDDRVTVGHLVKALEQLTQAATEAAQVAWGQVTQLTGLEEPANQSVADGKAQAPVFEGLARQITDVGRQLARLKRAQDAIGRALS